MATTETPKINRGDIARRAIESLVPLVKARGTRHAAGRNMPDYYQLQVPGFELIYTPAVVVDLLIRRPQSILDIREQPGRKVFSVHWEPMVIVAFKRGPWIDLVNDLSWSRSLQ